MSVLATVVITPVLTLTLRIAPRATAGKWERGCAARCTWPIYALLVLAGYRAWDYDRHPPTLRPAALWWHGAVRWSLATLWRGYRHALASRPDFTPNWLGTRGTWAEKEAWLRALDAVLAA